MVSFRGDLASKPLGAMLAPLSGNRPKLAAIPLPGKPSKLAVDVTVKVGRLRSDRVFFGTGARPSLALVLRDGNGLLYRLPATDFGVLGAWELLSLRDLHHIGVDLQPIAIGIQEIEGATAATAEGIPRAAAPLRSVDQGPLHNLDALTLQVRQGLQPLVAVGHLQRDVLQSVVAGIAILVGDPGGMREQDDVMMVISEAHKGHRTVFAHGPASRQREPQDISVPRYRPVNIGALDADVPHSANRKSPCHCVILLAAGSALV